MSTDSLPNFITDFALEQYVLGELPEHQKLELQSRLLQDAALAERLQSIQKSNADFTVRYPAERMVPAILERSHKKPARAAFFQRPFLPLALASPVFALLIVLGIFMVQGGNFFGSVENDTRLKGGSTTDNRNTQQFGMILYRKSGQGYQKINAGDKVASYESIQIAYRPAGKLFGMIFSVDGNGNATLQYPENFSGKPELSQEAQVLLPFAYQLDNAPYFERFYFVVSDTSFSTQDVWRLVEAQTKAGERPADMKLPPAFSVSTFDIIK